MADFSDDQELQVMPKDPYFSRAVGKAFEILELLRNASAPKGLNEVAGAVGLTKSSAFRLLYTLESLQLVQRSESGQYLGARSDSTAPTAASMAKRLRESADEPMRELNVEFRETISLAMLMSNHIEVLSVVDSPNLVKMSNITGRILPPHASSMGKIITAYQEDAFRAQLVASYGLTLFTPQTIGDERELERAFSQIRLTGLAFDDEENSLGGFCIGVPIFWPGKRVSAALSLSMPKSRLPEDMEQRSALMRALRTAADKVAAALGT